MLTGEVAPPIRKRLARLLVAAELHVLADLPVGIRPQQVRVGERHVERGSPVPVAADAGKDRLDLLEKRGGVVEGIGLGWLNLDRGRRHPAAGVVDEDPGRAVLAARHLPRILVTPVGVGTAVADPDLAYPWPRLVPIAVIELELQLGVLAIAELGDRRGFQIVKTGLPVIQRAQYREGDRQDDAVEGRGDRSARAAEREIVASVGIFRNGRQRKTRPHRASRQIVTNLSWELLVPTDNVIALVGKSEDAEVTWNGLKREQVDQIQRALYGGYVAVLDVVGDIEELTHRAPVPTGNTRLDPLVDAHLVQRDAGV